MNCFRHSSNPSVGICKSCAKAVCAECAIDTGRGIACCDECVKEVNDYNNAMDKTKNLYGMGRGGQRIPVQILMLGVFAVVMLGTGIYRYLAFSRVDYVSLLLGSAFLVLGLIAYKRNRNVGISC